MQAFKKEALQDYFLAEEAKALYANKFISKAQLAEVTTSLVHYKTNANVLLRIAFILLGWFLYSSIAGSLAIFTLTGDTSNSYKFLLLVYAIVGLIGAEILVRNNYFRQGLDDAFILGFQLCFCVAVGGITETILAGLFAMILVGAFCSLRYLHSLSVWVFGAGLVAVFFDLSTEEHIVPTVYLPFIGFLIAVLCYIGSQKLKDLDTNSFYTESLRFLKLFSLVLGYFSMNYMIVRELSQDFMHLEIPKGSDIPFAYLFYGFTFLIPIVYLVYGLSKKDRMFVWLGLLSFGYSIFTIRYYYSLLPLEYALVIGGCFLFTISFWAIRKWKDKTEGITFQPDRSADSALLRNAQMLIVTTQMSSHAPANQDKMPFGGGGFSGGGAGEEF